MPHCTKTVSTSRADAPPALAPARLASGPPPASPAPRFMRAALSVPGVTKDRARESLSPGGEYYLR